jgi:HEAT repeat protein
MALFPASFLLLWSASVPCDQLHPGLAALEAAASGGPGITAEEQRVAKAVQGYGRAAVPRLLELLVSPSRAVRVLAAYTLRDLDGLNEAEVPALAHALAAGEDWVAPALARIGRPSAVEALFGALVRRPARDNQVTYAFERLGARGVPVLLRAFGCGQKPPCDGDLLATVESIFHGLKAEGSAAVAPLTELLTDARQPAEVRLAAVGSLGGIGPSALSAAPALQHLAAGSTVYAEPVLAALQEMKSPVAGQMLAERLAKQADPRILVSLAKMGPAARAAGPAIVKVLGSQDWEVREAAARTIGYVGYREGAQALVTALGSLEDWQLVYIAAESLGRLGDARFVPALLRVEKEHWYPPVRAAAHKAQAVIRHLNLNRGMAYEVVKGPGARWSVRPWRLLPGAPNGSAPAPGGKWLIHTTGGSVLLAPDGSLSMAPCPKAP